MLADLSDDERYLVGCFIEAIRAPEPIAGLTPQQSRLVRVVRSGGGRVLPKISLAEAIALDPLDPPDARGINVLRNQIKGRRPDIAAQIENVWGEGLRWRADD